MPTDGCLSFSEELASASDDRNENDETYNLSYIVPEKGCTCIVQSDGDALGSGQVLLGSPLSLLVSTTTPRQVVDPRTCRNWLSRCLAAFFSCEVGVTLSSRS